MSCNNGYSLDAEPISVLTFSDTNRVSDVPWINVADTTSVLPTESNTEASVQGMKRSPKKATLLGAILGFGSWQYYSKRWISGTSFLVVDAVCWLMFIGGTVGQATYDDSTAGIFDEKFG